MAPKRNSVIPNAHFHKDWQRFVKTWFDQPAKKRKQHKARIAKARRVAPRPLGLLRPVVRSCGARYSSKTRLGKGFTVEELKGAGISRKFARSIGISVDLRRSNRCVESLQVNVQRLKEYKSKLILFPLNKKRPRKDDATPEEIAMAQQLKGTVMPLRRPSKREKPISIKEIDEKFSCYKAMRKARNNAKYWGKKAKKAKETADDNIVKK